MIIASAIRLKDGRIFVGKRHNDCFDNFVKLLNLSDINTIEATKLTDGCTMGFLTDSLFFLDRETAYHEAFWYGQCKEQKWKEDSIIPIDSEIYITKENWHPCLTSEDLW